MKFCRAETFADKYMFRCECKMFLGDVLVGEVEGIGVDSFEAVYLAIWNAKQDLREREIKFGYRFYWEDVEKGGLGQELDLDVSFGFYK